MSNKGDLLLLRLPLFTIIFLVLCAASLALHICAEGMVPFGEQGTADHPFPGENAHLIHEHCEDLFVFLFLDHKPAERSQTWPVSSVTTHPYTVLISPLLPPPNS